MTKKTRMTKFGLRHSFVIRASTFVILPNNPHNLNLRQSLAGGRFFVAAVVGRSFNRKTGTSRGEGAGVRGVVSEAIPIGVRGRPRHHRAVVGQSLPRRLTFR